MKKLNITKEQFNRSRYFKNKYGTLKYVSESGKVYKTSKGRVLKFNESVNSNSGEYFCIRGYRVDVYEDDYEHGEGDFVNNWLIRNSDELCTRNFESIEDALKAVCEEEGWDFNKDEWISTGAETGQDFGIFNGMVHVNDDSSEPSEYEIEQWKIGKHKLYLAEVRVELGVRYKDRDLEESDIASF